MVLCISMSCAYTIRRAMSANRSSIVDRLDQCAPPLLDLADGSGRELQHDLAALGIVELQLDGGSDLLGRWTEVGDPAQPGKDALALGVAERRLERVHDLRVDDEGLQERRCPAVGDPVVDTTPRLLEAGGQDGLVRGLEPGDLPAHGLGQGDRVRGNCRPAARREQRQRRAVAAEDEDGIRFIRSRPPA